MKRKLNLKTKTNRPLSSAELRSAAGGEQSKLSGKCQDTLG